MPSLAPARSGAGPIALALAAAVLIGAAVGVGAHLLAAGGHSSPAPAPAAMRAGLAGEATWAPGVRPAPPIRTLADQSGRRFSLSSLHGRTVALVFFDSHCNQQCPLEGRELAAAERTLAPAARPVIVAISVNPLDTPGSVRAAARAWGLTGVGSWHWLMGSHAQLAAVWRAYHIFVGKSVNGDIPHTEAVYLIDRRGDERSAYLYPFGQRFVTHDLRVLAAERRA